MAFDITNITETVAQPGLFNAVLKFAGGLVGLILFIVILIFVSKRYKNKKAFNIPVTIWIPRSDNTIVDEFPAVGGYFKSSAVNGITSFRLKRKGMAVIDIPPPSSKFLVGLNRHLYLVQKGMDDFEAVLPKSFLHVETADGKKIPIVNLKCINQEATAWMCDNAENAKKRFTIHGFWEKYKDFIQITIFIFVVFLAIYIMWFGLKDVVAALQTVADTLGQVAGNKPVVS